MADHIPNFLSVAGPEADLRHFRATCLTEGSDSKEFNFDAIIPQPAEVLNGQEWREEHWNTKWPGYDLKIESSSATLLQLVFSTAWDFAAPIFEALVTQFPRLNFEVCAYFPSDGIVIGRSDRGAFIWVHLEEELWYYILRPQAVLAMSATPTTPTP